MHDISAKRAGALLVAYLLLYVPGVAVVGVLEGGLRGEWALSLDDWTYQLEAYAAYLAVPVGLAGLVAVPLVLVAGALPSLWQRTVAGAVAGLAGVVGGLLIVEDVATSHTFSPSHAWPLEWARMFPAAFVLLPTLAGAVAVNVARSRANLAESNGQRAPVP